MNAWLFLVMPPFILLLGGAVAKVCTLHIPTVCTAVDFYSALILAHSWTKHCKRENKAAYQPCLDLLLTKLKWSNQNVGEVLVWLPQLTFMLVYCLTSLLFVRFQHNTGALVRRRPPDCHGVFHTLSKTRHKEWNSFCAKRQ